MRSPFPGMNPYLEHPDRWSTVHNRLIVALADTLTPQLLPKYQVDIDYQAAPTPPVTPEDAAWLNAVLEDRRQNGPPKTS